MSGFEYLSGVLLLVTDWYFLFFVAVMSLSIGCHMLSTADYYFAIEWNISDPLEACHNIIVREGVSGLMHNFLKINWS